MPIGQNLRDLLRQRREAATEWQDQAEQEWVNTQMAAAGQMTGISENAQARFDLELRAQQELKIDPEIDRIASLFFTCLMTRINAEFNHTNPTWDNLGAREKQHWLAATSALLEELKKEPVAKNELAVIAKRRIIQQ